MAMIRTPKFTPAEDAAILLWRDTGLAWIILARVIGKTTQQCLSRVSNLELKRRPVVPGEERRCLRCRGMFAPSHRDNRLCETCNLAIAHMSPLAAYECAAPT